MTEMDQSFDIDTNPLTMAPESATMTKFLRPSTQLGSSTTTLRNMESSHSDAVTREIEAVCKHLSSSLSIYEQVAPYLPLCPRTLFASLRDGIVLGYLLHHYYPGSIRADLLVHNLDLEQMDKQHSKVTFEVNNNLNAVIRALKSVKGIVVVNMGAEDILNGHRDLVLGLLWQILNGKLTSTISLHAHPELVKLAESNESLASLAALKSEALLFRWFNYHLQRAKSPRRIANFGRDISDSEAYVLLMHQVAPCLITDTDVTLLKEITSATSEGRIQRAELLLEYAKRLGCIDFLTARDIEQGHVRLNFAFTASIFNGHIGITLPSEDELANIREKYERAIQEKADLQAKLDAAEFALASHIEGANKEIENLKMSLAMRESEHACQLEKQKEAFETAKEELAVQYRESLNSAIEAERRSHQEALWELALQQKEARRQLSFIHSFLRVQLKAEDFETSKSEEIPEDAEIDNVIRMIGEGINLLNKKIHRLEIELGSLRETVAHKEKVNEMMGSKIKEYTELVITDKKDRSKRGSLLKRIFADQK